MNKQTTLQELVETLELQNTAKRDFVVESRLIKMDNGMIVIPDSDKAAGGSFVPNEVMHQHLAIKLGIPANYYKRMLTEAPELLQENVNSWLQRDGKNSLIRTFQHEATGSVARGMLSDRYGMIDNYDVLFAALESIKQSGIHVVVREATVTDRRMYVHLTAPDVEIQSETALRNYLRDKQIEVGTGIVNGIILTNSEVGFGQYQLMPRILIKVCMNGAIVREDAYRKVHLGGRLDIGNVGWSERTLSKNLDLIKSQTGDAIQHFLSKGYLEGVVQKIERAAMQKLDMPVDTMQNVIKEISKSVTLNDENKKNILNYFVQDGDLAASGTMQALTKEAQNLDADNRYEMEMAAFEILPKVKSFDHEFVAGKN